jgi:nucleotide-binding universal stress UspA family protein
MFTKVIVPLDGSDLAQQMVPCAAGIAHSLLIPLQLLHVVDPAGVRARDAAERSDGVSLDETDPHAMDFQALSEVTHKGYVDQAMENQEGWGRAYLGGLAQRLRAEGKRVETTVTLGTPAAVIAQEAQQDGQALVAMATHGRSGLARLFMGSVADAVLHHGTMPMLLFRPKPGHITPERTPGTIIVPLDGSALSEQALPLAAVLGRALGAKVLLARAMSTYALAPVPAGPGVFLPSYADDDAKSYLDTRVHSLCVDRVDADEIVLRGDPGMEIVRLAETTRDSMVLMTSHGRSGIARTVLGSVAEEIVRRSPSPVLVMRAG